MTRATIAQVTNNDLKREVDDTREEIGQVKEAISDLRSMIKGGEMPFCQVRNYEKIQMRTELDDIKKVINGSGSDKPGLLILVDRLIGQMKIVQYIGGALVIILLGELLARLLDLI